MFTRKQSFKRQETKINKKSGYMHCNLQPNQSIQISETLIIEKNSYLSQPLKLLFKMKTLKFHPLSFQFTSKYITLNSQHNGESYFLLNCDSLRFRLHVHEFDLVKNNFEAN